MDVSVAMRINTTETGRVRFAEMGRQLRRVGLRATAQRRIVLLHLEENAHATVAELWQILRSRVGPVSCQTVYSVLGAGLDVGIVRRFDCAGFAARYELDLPPSSSERELPHDHVVCRSCGRIDSIPRNAPRMARLQGYVVEEVLIRGLCPSCGTDEIELTACP